MGNLYTLEIMFIWIFRIINLFLSFLIISISWRHILEKGIKNYKKSKLPIAVLLVGIYWLLLSIYLLYRLFISSPKMLDTSLDEYVRWGITMLLVVLGYSFNFYKRG